MSLLEVFGQDRALRQLVRARQAQRVPHTYIFYGPEGVGKSLMAREWAKLQLCSRPVRRTRPAGPEAELSGEEIEDGCDTCQDCRLVQAGTHPDLHVVNKELARHTSEKRDRQMMALPIDVIREFVVEPVGRFPSRGQARVFIIEQAEAMNRAAQNALLKTLEEPPERTFLVLVTSRLDRLLPTVRSRSQAIRFLALPGDFVVQHLREAGVSDVEAGYWADFCQGELGAAMEWAQMGLYDTKCAVVGQLSQLSYASALELAGQLADSAQEFSQVYLKNHPDQTQSIAVREGQVIFLRILAHAFSEALRFSVGRGTDLAGESQVEPIQEIGRRFGPLGCAQAIRATMRAQSLLEANVNATLTLETLMLELLDCGRRGMTAVEPAA